MLKKDYGLMFIAVVALVLVSIGGCSKDTTASRDGAIEITNVSYDPTRELYAAYNKIFEPHYEQKFGKKITVTQSHGGSGKQALEVANGLEADVVTLALEGDVQIVANAGLIDAGFTSEFPLDSSPYTSTIVFLVRSGNPKKIYDWGDLLRDDVGIITFLSLREYPGEYEIVVPSVSILCQPTVAVVDGVVRKHKTEEAAKEYLSYLYSDEAQEVEARNFYRPSSKNVYAKYVFTADSNTITAIPEDGRWINDSIKLTNIEHFGGWDKARAVHFANGANFDKIYEK